jgi:hypothetical protein
MLILSITPDYQTAYKFVHQFSGCYIETDGRDEASDRIFRVSFQMGLKLRGG